MTGPVGAPDALSFARLARRQVELKRALDAARSETTTGLRAERFAAGDPGRLMALDAAVAQTEARTPLLALAAARAATTQATLEQAQTVAPKSWSTALLGFVEAADLDQARGMARDARSRLSQVAAMLDAQVDGRSLFGGDGGPVAPVIDVDALIAGVAAAMDGGVSEFDAADPAGRLDQYLGLAPTTTPPPAGARFSDGAYAGGAGDAPPVELAERDLLSYAVRGDDPALARLLGGLAMLVVAEETTDPAALGLAPGATAAEMDAARLDLWREGARRLIGADDALTARRAVLGRGEDRIEAAQTANRARRDVLDAARLGIEGVDPYEAATRLTELETQLQALYEVTARASQLSLLAFLR